MTYISAGSRGTSCSTQTVKCACWYVCGTGPAACGAPCGPSGAFPPSPPPGGCPPSLGISFHPKLLSILVSLPCCNHALPRFVAALLRWCTIPTRNRGVGLGRCRTTQGRSPRLRRGQAGRRRLSAPSSSSRAQGWAHAQRARACVFTFTPVFRLSLIHI